MQTGLRPCNTASRRHSKRRRPNPITPHLQSQSPGRSATVRGPGVERLHSAGGCRTIHVRQESLTYWNAARSRSETRPLL